MRGAVEGAHMDHPDFRANGRIFATLHGDKKWGMVKLTPDDQQEFVETHPGVFIPEKAAWGRAGGTAIRLAAADEEVVGDAMTRAWQQTARNRPVKRTSTRRKKK